MNKARITIRDVARRAGVSHQTVSRVINRSAQVSPSTRARVEQAIIELDYRPNAIARSMAIGRTQTIACISPNLSDYTFASIIEAAEREARRFGYILITVSGLEDSEFIHQVEQLAGNRRTEGLLVITPRADEHYHCLPQYAPVVFIGARPRGVPVESVSFDNFEAASMATRHLLELGHVKIAHITGVQSEDCAQERLAGYMAALQASGIPLDPRLIRYGDWSPESGYIAVRGLLDEKVVFSAVFAQNDRMAIGCIHALIEAGLNVPQDVSVIGVDDIPYAPYCQPPLTTIRQNLTQIGSNAAQLLIRAIENPQRNFHNLIVPAELVVRSSTRKFQSKEA